MLFISSSHLNKFWILYKLPFGISIVKTSTWEVNTGDFAELYDVIGFELDIWALICSSLDTLESLRRY